MVEPKRVKEMDFETYHGQNPRLLIPDEMMEEFLRWATIVYIERSSVSMHNFMERGSFKNQKEWIEYVNDEVKSYLGESMEALLLFKEFAEFWKKLHGGKS